MADGEIEALARHFKAIIAERDEFIRLQADTIRHYRTLLPGWYYCAKSKMLVYYPAPGEDDWAEEAG